MTTEERLQEVEQQLGRVKRQNPRLVIGLMVLIVAGVVGCGGSKQEVQWSAPPKFIIHLSKVPLDEGTQIELEISNDSPHQLSVLEADLECYSIGSRLTAKVPIVVHDLRSEESRQLNPIRLDMDSLEIASSHFVVKRACGARDLLSGTV
jgi:hypothetical protein